MSDNVGVSGNQVAVIADAIKQSFSRIVQQQIEEVAASVSALSGRVDVMQRELAAHVADLRRHERQPAPPSPDADAGDAVVDALIATQRALIDELLIHIREGDECFPRGYLAEVTAKYRTAEALYEQSRAAALPERSAAAPVTISRSRIERMGVWTVLDELGIKVVP